MQSKNLEISEKTKGCLISGQTCIGFPNKISVLFKGSLLAFKIKRNPCYLLQCLFSIKFFNVSKQFF